MRKFVRDGISSTAYDDDRRIPKNQYDGRKEVVIVSSQQTEADVHNQKAKAAMNESELLKESKKVAPDKRVNESVQASATVVIESEVIDDGLLTEVSGHGINYR